MAQAFEIASSKTEGQLVLSPPSEALNNSINDQLKSVQVIVGGTYVPPQSKK